MITAEGGSAIAATGAEEFQTRHAGELQIRQDQVEIFPPQQCQPLFRRSGFADLVPFAGQNLPEQPAKRCVIFNDQDLMFGFCHIYPTLGNGFFLNDEFADRITHGNAFGFIHAEFITA